MSTKSLLQRALEGLIATGALDGQVQSYSGRAMYGQECVGFSTDDADQVSLGVLLARWVATPGNFKMYDPDEYIDDKLALLLVETKGTRRDSLGLGVILYWPNIEFSNDSDKG
jgi:hypothetical protein